jgi:hypothetical protein
MKKKATSQSAFFNVRLMLFGALCVFGVAFTLIASGTLSAPSASGSESGSNQRGGSLHKLLVRDRQLALSLKDRGASVIADYGGFLLLEANDALTKGVAGNSQVETVDHNNLILLNAKTINTSTREAQSLRSAGSATGNQMRLIQFKGPVRPEWYQALVNTGVRIVTYIPNNTYLIYGGAGSLNAVRQLAATNPAVQWRANIRQNTGSIRGSLARKQPWTTDRRKATSNSRFNRWKTPLRTPLPCQLSSS